MHGFFWMSKRTESVDHPTQMAFQIGSHSFILIKIIVA